MLSFLKIIFYFFILNQQGGRMIFQKSLFHLLRGHRSRSRLLRKMDKPEATLEDAYRMVQSFEVENQTLSLSLTYNTKMFKRIRLSGSIPLTYFKSRKAKVAVFGPLNVISNTDADIKISKLDDIESHSFTHLIAYKDSFKELIPLGKYLGQKNVMPSVKKGTVTLDLQSAIDISRQSSIFVDNGGICDAVIGNTSYSFSHLCCNLKDVFNYINNSSGTNLDKNFVKQVYLRSTTSPAIPLKRMELKKMIATK
eukprot:NODE_120_length_18891_cov_0.302682.p7 type:complete len:253 gc:universal NODE_120_length_18891_cov_0.302682:10679-11437(+)